MNEHHPTRTLSLWLPSVALLVALVLILLALAADRSRRAEHALALEGEMLRFAHRVEIALREVGPSRAAAVLEEQWRSAPEAVTGLDLIGADGASSCLGACSGPRALEVELLLGRDWAGPPSAPVDSERRAERMAEGRGRRVLALWAVSSEPDWWERLLLPASAVAALLLVVLAVLGAVLLRRRQVEAERQAQRRRLEAVGRAGAGLAHQLRTPLATIKGSCQLLAESCEEPQRRRLEAVVDQTLRMEHLVEDLLDFARPPRPETRDVELQGALRELADLDPRVTVQDAAGTRAKVDPEHLRQIVQNLIDNALAADDSGGDVEVVTAQRGGEVEIRVRDRGPGPGGDPESLFEPYVTGRADGVGLGLPIARALAEANGGRLLLLSRPGGGADAILVLPRVEGAV